MNARRTLWPLVAVAGVACATTGRTPEQQISDLRDELSSSRRAQEELRSRVERLEAKVSARAAAPVVAPPVVAEPVDPTRSLPVVRAEPTTPRTGLTAPDVDTSIPFHEGNRGGPVVYGHTVTDSESPIDLNAVVARQSGLSPGKASVSTSSESSPATPDEQFQAAVMKYNGGQYMEATEAFRAFASRYPKHTSAPEALYLGGMSYVAANRCLDGKPMFETLVREKPGTELASRALLSLAKCEANVGHDDAARSLFNRVVNEHPTSTAAGQAKSALAELSRGQAQ